MVSFSYYSLHTLPRLRHIVWCSVPDVETGKPGLTVGPALVRASKRDPTTGRGALLVHYGTQCLDANNNLGKDLIIQNAARLSDLDLPKAVRFDLGPSNWLPWAYEFFRPPEHSLYIVAGPLSLAEAARYRRCLERRGIIAAM
jgi:hypothetical protein